MKALMIFLSSFYIYAGDAHCVSHAQCQNIVEGSTACYLVKTNSGTCETKCYQVPVGSYCQFYKDKRYGVCKDENYKGITVENTEESCKNALPQEVADELYNL
jgi:hypothetical protein